MSGRDPRAAARAPRRPENRGLLEADSNLTIHHFHALPVASLDAALVLTLTPGPYTAQVTGTGAGQVIVEVCFVD